MKSAPANEQKRDNYEIGAKMDVGRDPARDHLAETIMVEAVAWSVKHSKSQKLLL